MRSSHLHIHKHSHQIRSYYIASSHTRLIRSLTLHLVHAHIDRLGNSNQSSCDVKILAVSTISGTTAPRKAVALGTIEKRLTAVQLFGTCALPTRPQHKPSGAHAMEHACAQTARLMRRSSWFRVTVSTMACETLSTQQDLSLDTPTATPFSLSKQEDQTLFTEHRRAPCSAPCGRHKGSCPASLSLGGLSYV